jgi:hypothetical protein
MDEHYRIPVKYMLIQPWLEGIADIRSKKVNFRKSIRKKWPIFI